MFLSPEQAAEQLNVSVWTVRTWARNGIGDPIGDATSVYAWSLDSLRQRLADTSSPARAADEATAAPLK